MKSMKSISSVRHLQLVFFSLLDLINTQSYLESISIYIFPRCPKTRVFNIFFPYINEILSVLSLLTRMSPTNDRSVRN